MNEEQERVDYWEIVRRIENYVEANDLDTDEVLAELTDDLRVT